MEVIFFFNLCALAVWFILCLVLQFNVHRANRMMTVLSKCYVLYQFPVVIVFYIPRFLVCLKLNLLCKLCPLSPYGLSYVAVHTLALFYLYSCLFLHHLFYCLRQWV